jgi:hypothetical protein
MRLTEKILASVPGQPAATLGIPEHLINSADLAENAVLAGCCRNADYAADALSRLTAGDFDLEWRQTVWQAMVRLSERGERISSAALYPLLGGPLWERLVSATAHEDTPNPHLTDFVAEVAGWAERRRATAAMLARITLAEALP